jgi:predicted permease
MKNRRWHDIFRMRARSVFNRGQVERELDKELRFHLDQQIEEMRARGLPPEEARCAALKRIGGLSQIQEECRDMRRTNFLEDLKQDLRYAARMLGKSPGFTLVMVLTLGLSIGATSAIVSVIHGVLLRSLPYRNPDKLVRIFTSAQGFPKFPLNPNDFRDFRARLHSFESLAAYTRNDLQLAGTGDAIRLSGLSVTAGFFNVLGLKPAMGREFDRNDELPGKAPIVIISDKIWRNRLSGRRDVVGQKIVLDAVPYTVVGVMPPGIQHPGNMYHAIAYGDTVDIWTPFTSFGNPKDRGPHYLDGIARMRPGIHAAQAQAEMNAAMQQLAREHPDGDSGWNVLVIPLETEIVGRSERLLLVLLGAVMLLLLLACVNAANLLLARATARQRELAVRAAVGARRRRLVQQMLTESVLLAMMGAALGAVLAVAGVKALVALLPADFPRAGDIHVDAPIFLFTLSIAIGTGIFFGIVPALHGSRADLRESLHEGGRSATSSRGILRLRNGLVISEVTLACVLLMGAGLMLRSFVNLLRTDPGFRPEQTLTSSISLPHVSYKDNRDIANFWGRLLDKMRQMPGVTAAGAGSDLPWTGWDDNAGFEIQGEVPPPRDSFHARYHMATPGYFRALGISILRGRSFDDHDRAESRSVLIINEAMARFWQHADALGGRITFSDHPKEKDWLTIVGIVGDVKDTPKSSGAEPAFWWPMLQEPFPLAANSSIAIRSNLDTQLAAGRLRAAVGELDSNLAVSDVLTMGQVASAAYATPRFALLLVSLFATLALLLAAIGTYGVIAYTVSQRIHEFGVRMALGAQPRDVLLNVLANGIKLAVAGTALGILFGVGLSRLLGNLLYGVSAVDPIAISATSIIAIFVAAVACYLPALRATRADPMTALRVD